MPSFEDEKDQLESILLHNEYGISKNDKLSRFFLKGTDGLKKLQIFFAQPFTLDISESFK